MNEKTYVSISTGSVLKIIGILVFAWALFYVRDFVVALLVAVVLASAAEPPVRLLSKYGVPRGLAVGILFLSLFAIIAAVALIFVPPLADDLARFVRTGSMTLVGVRPPVATSWRRGVKRK
jgi:predicted PurR-regulated permease PerM